MVDFDSIKDFILISGALGISTWRMSTLPNETIKYRFVRGLIRVRIIGAKNCTLLTKILPKEGLSRFVPDFDEMG